MSEKLAGLKAELLRHGSDLPTVFIMRYFEDMKLEEIAEALLVEPREVETKLATIDDVVWTRFNTFLTKEKL